MLDPRDLRCSFCGNRIGKDSGTLGADVGICHECVNRAARHLASGALVVDQTANSERLSEYHCSFCYMNNAGTSVLFTARRQFVCVNCIDLIRREVIRSSEQQTPTSVKGIYLL